MSIKENIQLSIEKAEEKLKSAQFLLEKQFYEDSVSRSYYAIFHAIIACLRLKKVDLGQHKHIYLLNQFRTHYIDTEIFPRVIYGKILNIKSIREQADSSSRFIISKEDAEQILKDAKQILKEIYEYISTP